MSSLPLSFPLPSNVQNLNVLPGASSSELIHQTNMFPKQSTLPAPATPNSTSPTTEIELLVTSPLPTNNLHTNIPTNTHPKQSPILPREILTRSKTGKLKAKEFSAFKTFVATRHPLCVLSSIIIESEPACFTKAVTKLEWRPTMSYEFDALMANGTWSLCPQLSCIGFV
jgi:hypothetical protein